MKKVIVSLCVMLTLIGYPCASLASPEHTKAGSLVTTSLLGASVGILVGTMVAAFASSSDAGPILIGAGIGLGLGFLLALFTPSSEDEVQHTTEYPGEPLPTLESESP
ncbi:MAG: hypothetical protein BWZ01_00117 [Deltaproteobacteria bacterium ADurb.BinA179]|jgi:uncharacterized membrane protein YgaE (UPF0421/DUF939 family)|nr:hypothetical protein [Deltaproteobacteria bacterium]MDI9543589.1 hypothetical protein [Pseudomonadota bacterium]NLW68206.1 hypothetical protein [Bacteriovoracaceae bacterium]OPZ30157.1 MAG: hypothetical protein BWZ01_00117 [Deltaproteobacteria bacterium ADurb.BinA179]HNR50643.1 hypothetical protein [Deltaproteobacteria bacterium]